MIRLFQSCSFGTGPPFIEFLYESSSHITKRFQGRINQKQPLLKHIRSSEQKVIWAS